MTMTRAFVAAGSNINPEENIRAAIKALAKSVRVAAISTVYQAAAEGRPEQPPFYNCVVEIETDIPPRALKFDILRPIEAKLGRQRSQDKYAARAIDLDLIAYDDMALQTADLTLPDPEIAERPFLAIPLSELAPDLKLPGQTLRMSELAARLTPHNMRPLREYTARLTEN
jgi:2-amino-4-hydroxy-6-hydroxymethyldihydropteridine diphosphokinase